MKARIITSLMALAALLAVSCSKETGRQQEETSLPQAAISVQASVSELTKAATAGAETSFEAGDQLSLYVWTGSAAAVSSKKVVDGVVNTFDGTLWTPASRMLWKNVRDPHFFLGIFPAREVSSFTEDSVTSGEDLLVATVLGDGIVAPQTTTAPPVDLVFDHMMARLNVNVKYRNQWGGVPEDAVVVAKAATQGTIDYLTKTITPGEVTAQVLEAAETAAEGYDATYSSLCLPQEGVRTIEFVIDGQKLVYTHAADLPLAAGTVTTLSLLVGKDKIALDDNTVSDWEEGEI
ncbi:MAG: fimbrillin family protein, partial [Bacteroidales bacterium]|nr:fimbrillin family protein [Bacteroidales bacterium]